MNPIATKPVSNISNLRSSFLGLKFKLFGTVRDQLIGEVGARSE